MTSINGLAVALDTVTVEEASDWAAAVAPHAELIKLGLEFFLRNGAVGVATVREAAPDCGLFLDLKLHDIPATVAGGARAVAGLEPEVLTVHAAGGADMVTAAATELPNTVIAAVTVLTSLSAADLAELGVPDSETLVPRWAATAVSAGARAIVSSAREVAAIRAVVKPEVALITPGIRPVGVSSDDQARVATPKRAIEAGANVLVVGRPITQAVDPSQAAAAVAAEIRDAR